MCFLCPFQPFLLEAIWPVGAHILHFKWIWFVWSGACRSLMLCVCVWPSVSLIAVVVVFVVTAQGCEASQADPIWEKYLSTCIHPYLQTGRHRENVSCNINLSSRITGGFLVAWMCVFIPVGLPGECGWVWGSRWFPWWLQAAWHHAPAAQTAWHMGRWLSGTPPRMYTQHAGMWSGRHRDRENRKDTSVMS